MWQLTVAPGSSACNSSSEIAGEGTSSSPHSYRPAEGKEEGGGGEWEGGGEGIKRSRDVLQYQLAQATRG